MKKILIIIVSPLFFLSCSNFEEVDSLEKPITQTELDQIQVEIVNANLESETFIFEGKILHINISESSETGKLSSEWAEIFDMQNLVIYFDGSGQTQLFRDYDDFKIWDKANAVTDKSSTNNSQITGYTRLYDGSNYQGSQLLRFDSQGDINLSTISYGSSSWNDKTSSAIVNNTRVHFYENVFSGKRYIMEDRNLSPTIAIGQKNFRRVWLGGFKSWNNRITSLRYFPY